MSIAVICQENPKQYSYLIKHHKRRHNVGLQKSHRPKINLSLNGEWSEKQVNGKQQ